MASPPARARRQPGPPRAHWRPRSSGPVLASSVGPQVHAAADLIERLPRHLALLVGALGDDVAHQFRVVLVLLRAAAHAADLLHDLIDQRLLAVQTADGGTAATLVDPLAGGIIGINLVQVPHRALLRIARVVVPRACRTGL